MKYKNIREEELKNNVAQDYFWLFDCKKVIGNVDFCVSIPHSNKEIHPLVRSPLIEIQSVLWAEAKRGSADIYNSFVQLILTIGKARTFDKFLPPAFLGVFDYEKIAFIPYSEILDIFYINDFNWNVAPSNYETREFKLIHEWVVRGENFRTLQFNYVNDEVELRRFIKNNFADNKFGLTKIKIDKNNFIVIYNKWLQTVKPTIQVEDWNLAKKNGIIDGDFYLADLLSAENITLKEKLFVLLKSDHYILDRKIDESGFKDIKSTAFSDNQKAHNQFWNKYERPPKEEYWNYFANRRDLLVPQDVRERKGSFFTPGIWVELSQKYLADVLGEDWQDEYYVWDCCAGTGNLLDGLTNKYNIWASTLDKADVDVMKDRIENGANLLEDHVFQFDFLNDDFSKLPAGLQKILNDENKRKKLVIYINPPYAEASNKRTLERGNEGNRGVEQSAVNQKYAKMLGQGNAELFAQFLTRIYFEIPSCIIAEFSKLKTLSGQHFVNFRNFFLAHLSKAFICPANTFDNVKGKFPIGFKIWNTNIKERFETIITEVYDKDAALIGVKNFYAYTDSQYINDWIKPFRAKKNDKTVIGKFPFKGNDFQNQNLIAIVHPEMEYNVEAGQFLINENNLIVASIYFAVRKVIPATWLNDRDQFLYPSDGWKTDLEFQNDCLAYTLFNNNIQSKYGTNHWIPFTEYVVGSRDKFDSNFMTDFISGKIVEPMVSEPSLFYADKEFVGGNAAGLAPAQKREFSETAKNVFFVGLKLWKYYHAQPNCNVNASLYDIREHFQGRNEKGIMNNKSKDTKYNELIDNLRLALKLLAKKIEPRVYEYGFLI